jgi:hypothetical protein
MRRSEMENRVQPEFLSRPASNGISAGLNPPAKYPGFSVIISRRSTLIPFRRSGPTTSYLIAVPSAVERVPAGKGFCSPAQGRRRAAPGRGDESGNPGVTRGHNPDNWVLYHINLCTPCTALHCTALHCTALHCTASHRQGGLGHIWTGFTDTKDATTAGHMWPTLYDLLIYFSLIIFSNRTDINIMLKPSSLGLVYVICTM